MLKKALKYKAQRDELQQELVDLRAQVFDEEGNLKVEAELTPNQMKNLQKVKDFIEFKCVKITRQTTVLKTPIWNVLAVESSSDDEEE